MLVRENEMVLFLLVNMKCLSVLDAVMKHEVLRERVLLAEKLRSIICTMGVSLSGLLILYAGIVANLFHTME